MHISEMLKPQEEREHLNLNAEPPHVVYLTENAILHQYMTRNNKMVYTVIKLECIESICVFEDVEREYADMDIRLYSGISLPSIRFSGTGYKQIVERAIYNIRIKMA